MRARALSPSLRFAAALLILSSALGCEPKRPPVTTAEPPSTTPTAVATPPPAATEDVAAPLPVQKAEGEVIVAAWSEPRHLPPGGGQAQIVVRLQQRGGQPYPGVEVRLSTTEGVLYSQGDVLKSDASGMTRDRLTTTGPASVTVNAGGTVYRFDVPVGGS